MTLEETRQILYRYFGDEQSFMAEIDCHLRAYAKNELPKADQQRELVVLPLAALTEVEKRNGVKSTVDPWNIKYYFKKKSYEVPESKSLAPTSDSIISSVWEECGTSINK